MSYDSRMIRPRRYRTGLPVYVPRPAAPKAEDKPKMPDLLAHLLIVIGTFLIGLGLTRGDVAIAGIFAAIVLIVL
jgi:hypothetical protein